VIPPNAVKVTGDREQKLAVVCSNACAYQVEGAEDSEPCVTMGGTCEVCGVKLLP
jgi:hypothetical protein